MSRESRKRAEELFQIAADLPADERQALLEQQCDDDTELRIEVEALLRAHEADGDDLLAKPALAVIRPTEPGKRPGDRIGPYKLLSQLGEGGMGVVYLAEQEEPLRRRVALKIIKLGMDTKQVIARFEAERQALAMMEHACVAKVFDAGTTETGRPYFVMEYVPGVPITEYCDTHRLGIQPRLHLFTQVCAAVQHAHQKGIIHRDIKPTNVQVAVEGDQPIPKVIDFGVAKAINQRLTERTLFTEQGQLIGTPEYMSPEQAEMTGLNVDTRTDIYSLGVLLYELLTGALPFDPTTLRQAAFTETQRIIREVEPPKPSTRLSKLGPDSSPTADNRRTDHRSLVRTLRGDLDWITMKALDKERTRRYATASELAADIERSLRHEPVIAGPPSAIYRLSKFVRRNRAAVIAGLLVFAGLAWGTGASVGLVIERNEAQAEAERRKIAQQEATERLWESYLAQARAGRWTKRPGRRFDSLEVLKKAAAIKPSLELRNEAIACMSLADLRLETTIPGSQHASALGLKELDRFARSDRRGEISIVSIADGCEMVRLVGPPIEVRKRVFSSDGRYLAVKYHSGADLAGRVWDLIRAEAVLEDTFQLYGMSASFAPDSSWVAVGQSDNAIHLYHLPSGEKWRSLPPGPVVQSLSTHPSGRKLAASSPHRPGAWVIDVHAGDVVATMAAPSPIRSVTWSDDGRFLAGASDDSNVYVWDGETGELRTTLVGHRAECREVCFNPGGSVLASTSWDNTTRLWDWESGLQILTIEGSGLTGFRERLATISFGESRGFEIWRFEPGREHRRLWTSSEFGGGFATIGPDSRMLATAGKNGVRLWDLFTGQELVTLHEGQAYAVLFRPNGSGLIATVADGLRSWSLRTVGNTVEIGEATLLWPQDRLQSACLSPDGDSVIVCKGSSLSVFDLNERRERMTFPGYRGLGRVSISPDGRWIFTGTWRGAPARIWDVQTGEAVREFQGGHVWGGFNPDGRWLIVGTALEHRFHEVGTWDLRYRLERQTDEMAGPSTFTPDGSVVAVAHSRYEVRLVEVATGAPLATLPNPDGYRIGFLCFSPDGTLLAAMSDERVIQVWDLSLIRKRLRELGLDWDLPPCPPARATDNGGPLRVDRRVEQGANQTDTR